MSDGLVIMLLTYDRFDYAMPTLRSALRQVKYSRGDVRVHIAFDGDTEEYQKRLLEHAVAGLIERKAAESAFPATSSNSARGGYGANYNRATQTIHQLDGVKYVLPLEDDWEAIREIDADTYTLALDAGLFGCVRLGYLGYTQALRGTVVYTGDQHYLQLDPKSPEPHVFAGHPRLETVDWQRRVGPWKEGIGAGATEFEVAHRPEARMGVAWPMAINPVAGMGLFAHIGSERAEDIV